VIDVRDAAADLEARQNLTDGSALDDIVVGS